MIDAKFLTIKLDEINSVPKVFYKGEEITNLVHVGIDWATGTDETVYGKPLIDIEYLEKDSFGVPHTVSIKHNRTIVCKECEGINVDINRLYAGANIYREIKECKDCGCKS
ncbi:hypothetical protein KO561_12925 [Radiobacillus kanasensis]|uniref:hypothetical protein n=1 Tax=Radiobacillus kanasensis TaxID=2844358 RepID=UPI001E40A06C|nr:hypothetical protein [Radiobacillus kanasensis]UFT98105.1 hypothetical protein KO561_12925 [Radiobacillus kanasensis]